MQTIIHWIEFFSVRRSEETSTYHSEILLILLLFAPVDCDGGTGSENIFIALRDRYPSNPALLPIYAVSVRCC